ncbi:cysteine--tRNA ligase, partial [filamentous cyanobacterium CCP2]
MPLTLYNTLTRRKEAFEPIEPGKVKMYCCGVTVYDYCHLGHARSYIVWDTVRRYLQWRGYEVRYVQNFTDIDDKILNRAKQEGSTMQEVADRYTQSYFEDMARLNILEADEYPRATFTMDGIKRLIHELEQKGFAYASQGDVYYTVRNFAEYGKLSGRKLDEMQAGASGRVDADPDAPKKKDPFDFALWKAAKPGEPAWESPWGAGRPGWHIECSAMVREAFGTSQGDTRLGNTIDIHVGGADLVFPHHENEIAQSEAVTGHPLARYWMHNGMVNVGGEKMSKSLGNFTTIRALLDAPNAPAPMALRLFVLQAHYRKPIDFTDEAIESAKNSWETLKEGLLFGYRYGKQLGWTDTEDRSFGNPEFMRIPEDSQAVKRFQQAMDDD